VATIALAYPTDIPGKAVNIGAAFATGVGTSLAAMIHPWALWGSMALFGIGGVAIAAMSRGIGDQLGLGMASGSTAVFGSYLPFMFGKAGKKPGQPALPGGDRVLELPAATRARTHAATRVASSLEI